MLEALIGPLLAGLLVGVNPYLAPQLHGRLREYGGARRRLQTETTIATLVVMVLLAVFAWRFSAFLSGRLTNSLLFLGLFALGGAFYSLRPPKRHREPEPPATGRRWLARYASDVAFYAGPAWVIAMAAAMKQLTAARFALPFAAASLGIILATLLWTTRFAHALPPAPSAPGEARTRPMTLLSLAYGASAILMLAAHLKLL